MTKAQSAAEAIEKVERCAESNVVESTRVYDLVTVDGQPYLKNRADGKVARAHRQGDIYIHAVPAAWPRGAEVGGQLATGQSKGSRHMALAPAKCYAGTQLPGYVQPGWFMGPMVESSERFTVSHPEHAHVSLPPGCYQTTHQMDDATRQRVQD